MKTNHLMTSAILGILAGAACGGAQHPATNAVTSPEPSGAKDGCGNHPAGACAAVAGAKEPAAKEPAAVSAPGPLAIARTETVAPGEHVEINLTFATTTAAKATFKASAPLGWNVHSHPHGEMMIHEKGSGAAGEVAFQPPAPGTYSFLWTNDGTAPVTIEVKVSADAGVSERRR